MLHPPLNLWSCGQREEAAAHNSTGQIKIKQSIGVFSKPLEIQMRLYMTAACLRPCASSPVRWCLTD